MFGYNEIVVHLVKRKMSGPSICKERSPKKEMLNKLEKLKGNFVLGRSSHTKELEDEGDKRTDILKRKIDALFDRKRK